MVGDRHAMRISTEIVERPLWTTEGRLGVHHPFAFTDSSEEGCEMCQLFVAAQFTEELQFATPVRSFQVLQIQSSEFA